jgi:16S rRNA (uracil1498-N3)-methyltransferase
LPGRAARLIIAGVARRIHVPRLVAGETTLDPAQAHHARDELRLEEGAAVEVFDDAGRIGRGVLLFPGAASVAVRVIHVEQASATDASVRLTVAAAVPKGDRADWMVEKLSELGVAEFVPLAAARSVVLPEGKNKRERWVRLATEAAKQSRRAGVMRVGELTPLTEAVRVVTAASSAQDGSSLAWYLATEGNVATVPISHALDALESRTTLTAFVGPEGGWTDEELAQFAAAGARAVRLTETFLRVETAAVAVAAVVGCLAARGAPAGGVTPASSPAPPAAP